MAIKQRQPSSLFLIPTVIILASLLLLFGYRAYPPPYTDGIIYLPAAINWAKGQGLVNEVASIAKQIDSSGQARFIYYVPLFPIILGILMWDPGPQNAFFVISVLNVFSLLLCTVLFYRVSVRPGRELGAWQKVLISLALLALSTSFVGYYGARPEVLATLLIAAGALAATQWISVWSVILIGILIGLTALTAPGCALLSFAALGLLIGARQTLRAGLKQLLTAGFTAGATAVIGLSLSPHGLDLTVAGILKHVDAIDAVSVRLSLKSLSLFYVNKMFYVPIILASLCFAIFWWRRGQPGCTRSMLLWTVSSMALVYLFVTIVFIRRRLHYAVALSPVFFAFTVYYGGHFLKTSFRRAVLALLLLAAGTGFVRSALLFPSFWKQGYPLDKARKTFRELKIRYPQFDRYAISDSLWVLAEDYRHMMMCQSFFQDCILDHRTLLLWQQSATPFLTPPPQMLGYQLKEDHFVPEEPPFGILKLARTIPGYGFAVYVPPENQKIAEGLRGENSSFGSV